MLRLIMKMTSFQIGFVMGVADCIIYVGLDKVP